jgi:hypothetical protein
MHRRGFGQGPDNLSLKPLQRLSPKEVFRCPIRKKSVPRHGSEPKYDDPGGGW